MVSSLHATASSRGTGAAVERQGLAQAGGFGGADARGQWRSSKQARSRSGWSVRKTLEAVAVMVGEA